MGHEGQSIDFFFKTQSCIVSLFVSIQKTYIKVNHPTQQKKMVQIKYSSVLLLYFHWSFLLPTVNLNSALMSPLDYIEGRRKEKNNLKTVIWASLTTVTIFFCVIGS